MNQLKFIKPLFIVLLLVVISCESDIQELNRSADQTLPSIEIDPKTDENLQQLMDKVLYSKLVPTGRIRVHLDNLDLSKAIKRTDSVGNVKYTLFIEDDDPFMFTNMVLYENASGMHGNILEYQMDLDWLLSLEETPSLHEYTGKFVVYDLEGVEIYETSIVEGATPDLANGYQVCETTLWEICTTVNGERFCYLDVDTYCWEASGGGSYHSGDGNSPYLTDYSESALNGGGYAVAGVITPEEGVIELFSTISPADLWQENKVCTTSAFDNNNCASRVWDNLKHQNTAYDLLKGFNGTNPYVSVCLDVRYDFAQYQINGLTRNGNPIQIELNGNRFANRTEIDVVRTLFHELIHAEMYRKIQSVGGTQSLSIENFPGLFDYYSRYLIEGSNGSPQHNLMAAHYIGHISNALMEYDNVNSNNHQLRSLYEALAWTGLEETVVWKNKSTTERATIENQRRQLREGRSGCK